MGALCMMPHMWFQLQPSSKPKQTLHPAEMRMHTAEEEIPCAFDLGMRFSFGCTCPWHRSFWSMSSSGLGMGPAAAACCQFPPRNSEIRQRAVKCSKHSVPALLPHPLPIPACRTKTGRNMNNAEDWQTCLLMVCSSGLHFLHAGFDERAELSWFQKRPGPLQNLPAPAPADTHA